MYTITAYYILILTTFDSILSVHVFITFSTQFEQEIYISIFIYLGTHRNDNFQNSINFNSKMLSTLKNL